MSHVSPVSRCQDTCTFTALRINCLNSNGIGEFIHTWQRKLPSVVWNIRERFTSDDHMTIDTAMAKRTWSVWLRCVCACVNTHIYSQLQTGCSRTRQFQHSSFRQKKNQNKNKHIFPCFLIKLGTEDEELESSRLTSCVRPTSVC